MASGIPFDCFSLDVGKGIHKFDTDTLKIYLSNVAPNVATDTVYGTPADIGTGGGYTAGGISTGSNVWSQSGGIASLVPGADLTFTATTGFGPFRYVILYNFTAAAKNLICYWDNAASVSIGAAQSFTVDFGPQILTLQF